MPEHHGEAFDEYLRVKKINRTKLIKSMDVARGTFYSLLTKRTFDKDELEQVRRLTGFVPNRGMGGKPEPSIQSENIIHQSIQNEDRITKLEHDVQWHKDNFDKLMIMFERLSEAYERLTKPSDSPTKNIPIPKTSHR